MRRLLKTAVIAVAFAAMAVSSASATTGPAMFVTRSPIGIASNTASISGNASSYGTHIFSVSGVQVRCLTATFRITSVATTSLTLDPIYGTCVLFAGANFPATVSATCDWNLSIAHAVYNNLLGALVDATLTKNCHTVVTAPTLGCTITVYPQTRGGISAQNITQTGAVTASASPWGSSVTANVTGLTYTAALHSGGTCGGIAEHGIGSYSGTVAVSNVWGSL